MISGKSQPALRDSSEIENVWEYGEWKQWLILSLTFPHVDLDRLPKSGPSFGVCFGTDRLSLPAKGRWVGGGTGRSVSWARERGLASGQKCRLAVHTGPLTGARVSITQSVTSSPRSHHEEEEEERNGCDFAKAVRASPNIYTEREEPLNFPAKFVRGSPLKLILQTWKSTIEWEENKASLLSAVVTYFIWLKGAFFHRVRFTPVVMC